MPTYICRDVEFVLNFERESAVLEKGLDGLNEVSGNAYFVHFVYKTRVPHSVERFINVDEHWGHMFTVAYTYA